MRQKIIIKVCHSKALRIAAGVKGVESVELAGNEKDQLVVIGDGIDAIKLIRRLKKKVAHAELVSVGEAKKEPIKPNPAATVNPPPQNAFVPPPPPPPPPYYNYCVVREPAVDPICTIM